MLEKGGFLLSRFVYEQFGSKNGLLRYFCHSVLAKVGVYRRFYNITPTNFDRLVFICSGNICRSPLAEAYARSLGKQAASCGLSCGDGFPADPRARDFAKSKGLTLDDHKTVNVSDFQFQDSDLVIVMEPSHLIQLRKKVTGDYRVVLAGGYCTRPIPYIHDPYNCNEQFFIKCETKVMEAVRGLCA